MPFEPADRLKALPPYLFVEIDRKKRLLLEAGKDVINFGVGDPDQPTHSFIIDRLTAAVRNPEHHRYPRDRGLPAFRQTLAAFFERRYGVQLDPEREIYVLIGSKEGLGHLPLAVVNPGRTVLYPEPGYPVYRSAAIFAGGIPWAMRLNEERGWMPDLDAIPPDVARSAALMILNYPNNPTGALASREFLTRAVAFCRRHEIILAQDAAYNEMTFDEPAPSILQIPGARDVAIELHSLSKTFNMTGWRLAFAVGNEAVLDALGKIKANMDSGQFGAIQEAGIAAYEGIERDELHAARRMYSERMRVMAAGLRELGFAVREPRATFYIWAGVPRGYDALRVVNKLLDEAAIVCVPGTGFGAAGEGFVRFAVTVDIERIRQALARMRALQW
jgi:LL-diaminopimelate aminotransferase